MAPRAENQDGSVRLNGHVLPPTGLLTGRFDRYPLQRLKERSLARFETTERLRVAGIRGLEEQHPVLQSARYVITREFALDCRDRGLDGILYASAQHANHGCVCLFESGIRKLKRTAATPLVKSDTQQLHRAVVRAA